MLDISRLHVISQKVYELYTFLHLQIRAELKASLDSFKNCAEIFGLYKLHLQRHVNVHMQTIIETLNEAFITF